MTIYDFQNYLYYVMVLWRGGVIRTELGEGVMQWVGLVDASAVLEKVHILL